jgi:hypothetical protein
MHAKVVKVVKFDLLDLRGQSLTAMRIGHQKFLTSPLFTSYVLSDSPVVDFILFFFTHQ